MANPTIERATLTRLLNTPNLTVLVVNVVIQGQIQIEASGPGALDRVKVLLLPGAPQNILDYAPSSWWLNSTSLFSAVDNGFLDVVTETPVTQSAAIPRTGRYIPEPMNPQLGDMLVYNGVGWDRLPAGPLGYVVTSNGPGIVPTYQPQTGGGAAGDDVTVTLNCLSSVGVGDIVCVQSANTVMPTTALGPRPAVGIVQEKPTPTTAVVVLSGRTKPIFTGLIPGTEYFLSTSGSLTATKPTTVGSFIQLIGTAQNATTLLVNIDQSYDYTPSVTHVVKASTALSTDESTELSVYLLIGGTTLNGDDYDTVEFATTAAVTSTSLQGQILLWNLTDGVTVATHVYNDTAPTELYTTLSLPSGQKTYEVRHRVTGGTTTADRILTSWAGFRTTKTITV